MVKYFTSLIMLLILVSCQKEVNLEVEVSGRLIDAHSKERLGQAEMELLYEISGTSTVRSIGNFKSASDGSFNFKFERKNAIRYILKVESGYTFPYQLKLNSKQVHEKNSSNLSLGLEQVSTLRILINNEKYNGAGAFIRYAAQTELNCDCCANDAVEYQGNINEELFCDVPANLNVEYNFVAYDGKTLLDQNKTVSCLPGDTCIFYYNPVNDSTYYPKNF